MGLVVRAIFLVADLPTSVSILVIVEMGLVVFTPKFKICIQIVSILVIVEMGLVVYWH